MGLLILATKIVWGAAAEEDRPLLVTAVGDVRISESFLAGHGDEIRKLSLRGDLVFANLEGVVSDTATPDPWKFSVPSATVSLLRAMGINAVSLANNHALDLGEEAQRQTALRLRQSGFWVADRTGMGDVAEIRGRRVRVIGFSFGSPNDVLNLAKLPAILRKRNGEIIVVSAHMGSETGLSYRISPGMEFFGREKRGDVVRFSRRCIDAGADLVLGHGPHVPRAIELYKGRLIVYSLGNFVFDYPGAERHPHAPGYSISVTLDQRGEFRSGRIDSYDLRRGLPEPDEGGAAYRLIEWLTLSGCRRTSLRFPGKGAIERSSTE